MPLTLVDEVQQILAPDGQLVGKPPDLSDQRLLELYRWMVFGRQFSDRMVALQRQGRIGTFGPMNGQEAALVGMAAPLQSEDWLLGSYRELLAYFVKGVPPLEVAKSYKGQIGHYPRAANCLPYQIVLATQMLHAVGVAMALKYDKAPGVVVGVCGDGATSEGDFNEALNFAGVFKAPIVLIVQNNGWAISVPRSKQTAARYIADRGPGFGMPGYAVDGNDILAVHKLVAECVARARSGEGPSLIEALTYRLGAHTTADDPKKYRAEDELRDWTGRDPLQRFCTYLVNQGLLDEAADTRLYEETAAEIQGLVDQMDAQEPLDPARLFDLVFAEPTPQLRQQRDAFLHELGR